MHRQMRGRQRWRGERFAQRQAGFTEFDSAKADRADDELAAHKFIQPYTAGDDIPSGCEWVNLSSMLLCKGLNCLGLDKRDVLARFGIGVEVTVAFDSSAGDDANRLVLDRRVAAWRTDEDALNAHGCL